MTLRSLLAQGTSAMSLAQVDSPALDALVLLAFAAGTTKETLIACLPDQAAPGTAERYRECLARRAAGVPVSYLRGVKEFFGLEFLVDERVLVPRPDTETLVELARELIAADPGLRTLHDACTGSGCVAIALARVEPGLDVSASDISARAAEVFALNSQRLLGRQLPFVISDLLEAVGGGFHLITANPPYLAQEEVEAMAAAGWPEPPPALRGGREGTELAARLILQAPGRLAAGGWLALEAGPAQSASLAQAMAEAGFSDITVRQDLAGRDRVIAGRRGSRG
jgi:release factor glutamine methyltransferase